MAMQQAGQTAVWMDRRKAGVMALTKVKHWDEQMVAQSVASMDTHLVLD